MPPGEEMFKYHGFSGNCPRPPLPSGNLVGVGRQADPEFTGEKLEQFIIEVETVIGTYKAGMTPLGQKIIKVCEDTYRRGKEGTPADG